MPLRSQLRDAVYSKFIYYRELHFSNERIEKEILRMEITEDEFVAIQNFMAAEKRKAKHQRGLVLTSVGSVILILGFIITAILFHQNSPLQGVMYGLTALGLVLLIWGLIDLF